MHKSWDSAEHSAVCSNTSDIKTCQPDEGDELLNRFIKMHQFLVIKILFYLSLLVDRSVSSSFSCALQGKWSCRCEEKYSVGLILEWLVTGPAIFMSRWEAMGWEEEYKCKFSGQLITVSAKLVRSHLRPAQPGTARPRPPLWNYF